MVGIGALDGVVANAGIGMTGNLVDLSVEQWRMALEVNTTSQFLLTKRVWPVFERQGIGGSLVYVWGWILVAGIIIFIVGTSMGVRSGRK